MKTVRVLASALLALALLVFAIGVAYAFVVTVDGNPADWGTTPPTASDPNESGINQDGADIDDVYHTTDSTKIYFRVDTYANQTWMSSGGGYHWVMVCLNTDNNINTGVSGATNCLGMKGIDYRIIVQNTGIGLVTGMQRCTGDGTSGSCSLVGGAVVQAAYATTVLEISARLSDLGGLGGSCTSPLSVPASVYWDGGDQDPDDNIPDNGTFNMTINCPTAVTLSSMSAKESPSVPVLPFAAVGLLGVGALGLFVVSRRAR
jgi:hypothetical protein